MANMVNSTNIEQSKRSLEPRDNRFVVMLKGSEISEIQGYRFERRHETMAAAARELIEKGLAAAKSEAATGDEIAVLAPAAAENHSLENGNAAKT